MKYLITGAAGFIGCHFVHYLYARHKGIEVVTLDKMTYASSARNIGDLKKYPRFSFMRGDIADAKIVKKAMKGVEVVVNFAAESAVDRSIHEPGSFLKTNVLGVYTLLQEACRQKQMKRFVQISTDEVYGEIRRGNFREDSELKPRNPYAASKAGGDRLAYSFFATYGLPVIITRSSNNYGPRTYPEKVIPLFITNIMEGRPVPVYGQGKQVRDWLFVEDNCRAIELLIKNGVKGEVYNIGAGQERDNLTLAKTILTLMGRSTSFIKFVHDRPGHDFRYSLDCSKIKKLGWRPRHSLEEGLKKTIAWYQDNNDWWHQAKKRMDRRFVGGYWGGPK